MYCCKKNIPFIATTLKSGHIAHAIIFLDLVLIYSVQEIISDSNWATLTVLDTSSLFPSHVSPPVKSPCTPVVTCPNHIHSKKPSIGCIFCHEIFIFPWSRKDSMVEWERKAIMESSGRVGFESPSLLGSHFTCPAFAFFSTKQNGKTILLHSVVAKVKRNDFRASVFSLGIIALWKLDG